MLRDVIIRKLESHNRGVASVLKSICKKHQPEEDLLFGSQVHKALNERAQTLDSFKKVAVKVSQPQSNFRPSGKEKLFFRDSPARDRGHGSGRNFRVATGRAESSDHQTNNSTSNAVVVLISTNRSSYQRTVEVLFVYH